MSKNKKMLNESEIRSEFITPALRNNGWRLGITYREEYPITQGRIIAGRREQIMFYFIVPMFLLQLWKRRTTNTT